MTLRLSIVIPAHQEETQIGACLRALADHRLDPDIEAEVIVVANGCTDHTADRAREMIPLLAAHRLSLRVIDTPTGGKPHALNLGDAAAGGDLRIYLDADVVVGPGMLAALHHALDGPGARYAGARLVVPPAASRFSRHYARFWQRLPFVAQGVTGAGLFAVNAEGRARWSEFPPIIADDGYVRLHFAPHERRRVDVAYAWPISEGFGALTRVRRRQDAGNAELRALYPRLTTNAQGDRPSGNTLLRLAAADPVGFAAYAALSAAVRLRRQKEGWARSR